jgi:hypothetical protein
LGLGLLMVHWDLGVHHQAVVMQLLAQEQLS